MVTLRLALALWLVWIALTGRALWLGVIARAEQLLVGTTRYLSALVSSIIAVISSVEDRGIRVGTKPDAVHGGPSQARCQLGR